MAQGVGVSISAESGATGFSHRCDPGFVMGNVLDGRHTNLIAVVSVLKFDVKHIGVRVSCFAFEDMSFVISSTNVSPVQRGMVVLCEDVEGVGFSC